MGYAGYLELKQKARELRKKGISVREIHNRLNVSKSSASIWTRDIKLTKKQLLKLYKNRINGRIKGSYINAKKQQAERIRKTSELHRIGMQEVGKLSKRDKFIIGIALYSGEGTKGDRNCGFANSDPELIKFMAYWFREFCKVQESKLRGSLWIHENLDIKKAEKFWSKLTNISLNQFQKTYVVQNKTKKIRKNIHEYGVFAIKFTDSSTHRKLMGWIKGILKMSWYNN
jgi:hypothetical protein